MSFVDTESIGIARFFLVAHSVRGVLLWVTRTSDTRPLVREFRPAEIRDKHNDYWPNSFDIWNFRLTECHSCLPQLSATHNTAQIAMKTT